MQKIPCGPNSPLHIHHNTKINWLEVVSYLSFLLCICMSWTLNISANIFPSVNCCVWASFEWLICADAAAWVTEVWWEVMLLLHAVRSCIMQNYPVIQKRFSVMCAMEQPLWNEWADIFDCWAVWWAGWQKEVWHRPCVVAQWTRMKESFCTHACARYRLWSVFGRSLLSSRLLITPFTSWIKQETHSTDFVTLSKWGGSGGHVGVGTAVEFWTHT